MSDIFSDKELEQLDELSKKTLGSYVKKAALQKGTLSYVSGVADGVRHAGATGSEHGHGTKGLEDYSSSSFKKTVKRSKGISKAVERLTKEDLDQMSDEDINELIENIDQLDELSKKTLTSYVKKATTSSERSWDKASKEEDKAMSTDGNKYPEKQQRHNDNANKAISTWRKRESGLKMASKKLKESEEQEETEMNNHDMETDETLNEKAVSDDLKKTYETKGLKKKVSLSANATKFDKAMKEDSDEDSEDLIDDESLEEGAEDTLRANSAPAVNPESRVEVMKAVIGQLASMESKELTKWFSDMMSQTANRGQTVPNNAAKNAATIKAKPSDAVKEEVASIFAGEEFKDLSEEYKDKTATLIEAAIDFKVIQKVAELEEQYEARLNEELQEAVVAIAESVEKYLQYTASKWLEENEVAIESNIRVDVAENFIHQMLSVFMENNIMVPEKDADIVSEMQSKIDSLAEKLDESIQLNNELNDKISSANKEAVFAEVSEGLVLTQADKLRQLAEAIDFDGDVEKYRSKLVAIKDRFIVTESVDKKPASIDLNESVEEEQKEEYVDPSMRAYVQTLKRIAKANQ